MIADRFRQFRKLISLLPSRDFRRGLRHGVAASIEHRSLMRSIRPTTVIDVGANVGQFSLLIRTLHPNVRIFAFEPLSRPAARFTKLFSGDTRTTLYRHAAGPMSVADTMFVGKRDDSSSLLPNRDDKEMVGTEQVEVKRLDDVLTVSDILRPALLKMDVQGYELSALNGCGPILDVMDFVYVEVSFRAYYLGQSLADEVVQFLMVRGFSIVAVNDPTFDSAGHCMQADFLFCRRST